MFSPKVTITFDDGHKETSIIVNDILKEFNYRGVFFVPVKYISNKLILKNDVNKIISWADIKKLINNHHEIGSHSYTHHSFPNDNYSNFNKIRSEIFKIIFNLMYNKNKVSYYYGKFVKKIYNQIYCKDSTISKYDNFSEIILSKDTLEKRLNIPIHSFAYPGGNYSRDITRLINQHYNFARTTQFGFENINNFNNMEIKSFIWDKRSTPNEFKKYLKYIEKRKLWLIETFHKISDDNQYEFNTSPEIFIEHLNLIKKFNIEVITFKDLLS